MLAVDVTEAFLLLLRMPIVKEVSHPSGLAIGNESVVRGTLLRLARWGFDRKGKIRLDAEPEHFLAVR